MYRETIQSQKLYSTVAEQYDLLFERAILSETRLTQLTRQLMNGRRVLDLACGNGRWLERFNPADYVGLDLNCTMLEAARRQHPGHQFWCGDMTRLPFRDGVFDGVLSMFGAMGHLPTQGQEQMLSEIHRVLRPDGLAIITNGNRLSPFAWPVTITGNRVKLEGVRFRIHTTTPTRLATLVQRFELKLLESYDYSFVPVGPVKFLSCLMGRDYRRDYTGLMDLYENCRWMPGLRWFGKQLVAVCQKH